MPVISQVFVPDAYPLRPIEDLQEYKNNPVIHPDKQKENVKKSIQNYGFLVPILCKDKTGEIADGHLRLEVGKDLGMDQVPYITVDHLSEEDIKGLRIAIQKTAYEGKFDDDLLEQEFRKLDEEGFDLGKTGFSEEEATEVYDSEDTNMKDAEEERYTDKIRPPTYEPQRDEPPRIEELLETGKFVELKSKIQQADIPDEVKDFLELTSYRHIRFNYEKIAEYYAHTNPEIQKLMEDLALVVIDSDKAIEKGLTTFTKEALTQ